MRSRSWACSLCGHFGGRRAVGARKLPPWSGDILKVSGRVEKQWQMHRVLTLFILRVIKDVEIPRMPVEVMPLLPKNDPERLKIEYDALID